jgi:nitroreductase
MALLDVIQKRYSCRDYEDKPIEQEKLEQVLDAARQAPSARNMQDWRFVVVKDKKTKAAVASTTNKPEVFGMASVIIAACSNSDYVMKCGQWIGPIDVAIALEHISLQATHLGLGTCWIGSFDEPTVRVILDVPEGVSIIELMALGYPADEEGRQTDREPIETIACYDKWQFD